jgi:hypothetical protein
MTRSSWNEDVVPLDVRALIAAGRAEGPSGEALERTLKVLGVATVGAAGAVAVATEAAAATVASASATGAVVNGAVASLPGAAAAAAGAAAAGGTVAVGASGAAAGSAALGGAGVSAGIGVALAQWVGVGAVSAAVLIGGSRLMLGEPAGAPPPSASVAATASAPRSPTPPLLRRSPLANPAATVPAAGPPALSEAARPGAPDRVAEAAPQLSPAEIKQLRETQLQQELLLLDAARLALDANEPERALVFLDEHRSRFVSAPQLRPEASALRMRAQLALGHTSEARATAQELLRANPTGPHSSRAKQIISGSSP